MALEQRRSGKTCVSFLFLHPLSESLGSTSRLVEVAKSLKNKGFEVKIYSPFENKGEIESIKVKRIGGFSLFDFFVKKAYSFLKRIYYGKITRSITANKVFRENFFYKRLAEDLAEKLRNEDVDVLVIEQDFAIVPGLLASKSSGVPVIVDLHNITAEELVTANILRYDSLEYREMQSRLGELLNEVEGIAVVSEALRKYIYETYGIRNNVILVPPAGRVRIRKIPKRPLPCKFIFAGLLSYREKVDIFVKSLVYLKKKIANYEVYMTKKGDELKRIKMLSKIHDLNINFFWFKTRGKLFDFMKQCHVGILTSSKNKARMLGPPIKLFDYMSVGLPVVANYIGGWSEIIRTEKVGIATGSEPKEFAEGIFELISDEDIYYNFANNALRAIKEKYNWDKVTEPLVDLIHKFS